MAWAVLLAMLGAALAALAALAGWVALLWVVQPWLAMRALARQGVPTCRFVPVLGQLPEMVRKILGEGKHPNAFFVSRVEELGRVFGFCAGPTPYLFVADPRVLRQVFVSHARHYTKAREENKALLRPLLGDGVLLSEGAQWERSRSALNPAFHWKKLASLVPVMFACVGRMVAQWEAAVAAGRSTVEVHAFLGNVGLETVATCLFGSTYIADPAAADRFTQRHRRVLELVRERATIVQFPLLRAAPLASLREMRALCAELREMTAAFVDRCAAAGASGGESLLELLLEAGLPRQQLLDEALNVLAAGAETTSTAMTWLFYELARDPRLADRCLAEIARVLGDAAPSYDALHGLDFVEACAYEALRLYPPAATLAKAAASEHSLDLGDGRVLRVPAGLELVTEASVLQRDPTLWERPEEFRPERFLRVAGAEPEAAREQLAFAYLPFSAGARMCLGKNFAVLEIKSVLCHVLRRFTLQLAPGQVIRMDWFAAAAPAARARARLARSPHPSRARSRLGPARARCTACTSCSRRATPPRPRPPPPRCCPRSTRSSARAASSNYTSRRARRCRASPAGFSSFASAPASASGFSARRVRISAANSLTASRRRRCASRRASCCALNSETTLRAIQITRSTKGTVKESVHSSVCSQCDETNAAASLSSLPRRDARLIATGRGKSLSLDALCAEPRPRLCASARRRRAAATAACAPRGGAACLARPARVAGVAVVAIAAARARRRVIVRSSPHSVARSCGGASRTRGAEFERDGRAHRAAVAARGRGERRPCR
jgi:cytochrome P450